jgi:hypothetical protein
MRVALETAERDRKTDRTMNDSPKQSLSKVPEVTLGFWIIKIAATTLGETGGDSVTMTLNWGYLIGALPRSKLSIGRRSLSHRHLVQRLATGLLIS